MSATLESTLLANKAAAAGGGSGYQIKKSLRFNSADTPKLSRTFTLGDTRTLTWSGWVKRNKLGAKQSIFGAPDTGNTTDIEFDSSDRLIFTDGGSVYAQTTAVFRDPAAWYHIVFALDANAGLLADRCKLYVNGKLQDVTTQNYGQGGTSDFGTAGVHTVGSSKDVYSDTMLADVHYIDGLALSPAAFGEFDSNTGVWNPKAFAFPTPNTDAESPTWSSGYDSNNSTPANGGNAFDGSLTTYTNANATQNCGWNPPNTIEGVTEIRLLMELAGSGSGTTAKCNDVERWADWVAALGRNTKGWWTVPERKLIKNVGGGWNDAINFANNGNDDIRIYAIEVDGVILVDGQTDPTTRNNPNNGTTWTDYVSGEIYSGQSKANAFDGNITSTAAFPSNGNSLTFSPPGGITAEDKIEYYALINGSGTGVFTHNGTSMWSSLSGSGQWIEAPTKTLTSLVWSTWGAYNQMQLYAIRVDGHILLNSSLDNSFNLKFNDTSLNRYLGKDTLNGKIADATGGLPIYNTDATGDVKGSGNRTDSLSGNLKLALLGDNVTEADMDVSSANHDVDNDGVTVSTDYSRFYGSSLKFVASETDSLKITGESDFAFGTGDLCVEFWVYNTANKNYNSYVATRSSGAATDGFVIASNNSGILYVHSNAAVAGSYTGEHVLPLNKWTHVAYTRASGTHRLFMNGVAAATASTTSRDYTNDDIAIGTNPFDSEEITAYMNDVRVYKGAAKYTANFKPPTRNDFTVTNLSHATGGIDYEGTTTASATGQSTSIDGTNNLAKLYSGGGDSAYLATASANILNNSGVTLKLEFDPPISVSSSVVIRVYNHGNCWWSYNGGSETALSSTGDWLDVTVHSGSTDMTEVTFKRVKTTGNATGSAEMAKITVDGTELLQSQYTAASGVDSFVDTPTNYGTDTSAGGEVRGNYATMNPLDNGGALTLTQGNLQAYDGNADHNACRATFKFPSTGKWYYEATVDILAGANCVGAATDAIGNPSLTAAGTYYILLNSSGNVQRYTAGSHEATYSGTTTPAVGSIFQVAYDADAEKLWVGFDNQWMDSSTGKTGNPATGANATWTSVTNIFPATNQASSKVSFNFGQRAFQKTVPSGFKCLCTQNLDDTFSGEDDGTVNNPSKFFDVKLFTGGTAQTIPFGFSPNFVWHKERNNSQYHILVDSARGEGTSSQGLLKIYSNNTENEHSSFGEESNKITFNGDGVQFHGTTHVNSSGDTFVLWGWDAGTEALSSYDSADITPDAQWVNTKSGFSVTKYEGTGGDKTVPHALNAKPDLVIIKNRANSSGSWVTKHSSHTSGEVQFLDNANAQNSSGFGEIANLSNATTVTLDDTGNDGVNVNKDGDFYVMYAWTAISGYSAFGKYSGSGSGLTWVHTGFRPKYVLIKCLNASTNWKIYDSVRDPNDNPMTYELEVDTADEEGTTNDPIDFNSNGFMVRGNSGGALNGGGNTYIYAAFAEHPQKIARAR